VLRRGQRTCAMVRSSCLAGSMASKFATGEAVVSPITLRNVTPFLSTRESPTQLRGHPRLLNLPRFSRTCNRFTRLVSTRPAHRKPFHQMFTNAGPHMHIW